MGREDPVAQRFESRSVILTDARPQPRWKPANSRSTSQKNPPVESYDDDEDILDNNDDADPFAASSDPHGRLMSEPSVISVASISKSHSVASVYKNSSIASGSYIAANANHQDRSVASARARGKREEEESKQELTLSPFDYSVEATTVPARGGNSLKAFSRPSDKIHFGSDWETPEGDGESNSSKSQHKSDSEVEAAVNGNNNKSTAHAQQTKSAAGHPCASIFSNKTSLVIAALVLFVVILAAALTAVLVGQNKTGNVPTSATSNSNSTPSTMPPATMPPSPTGTVKMPPTLVPPTTFLTAAPSPTVIANPAAVMNTGLPLQDPATMAPSVCLSPADCVKNELWPFLPDSTRAKLNDTESCQYKALEWIADSVRLESIHVDLSFERVTQPYALAVLDCEMNLTNDSTGFLENECDWLAAISGVDPCNDNDIVESLMLSGKQLTGTLPPELSMMSNITVIDFSSNQIYGSIPSELGALLNLEVLLLSNNNKLTESMPEEVCALRSFFLLKTLVVDCPSNDQSLQQTGVNCSCCTNSCIK